MTWKPVTKMRFALRKSSMKWISTGATTFASYQRKAMSPALQNSNSPKLQPSKSSNSSIFESLNHESLNYSQFSIIAEPYFDINFNELFYITDTGRCWDGHLYNLRDKATKENPITNPEFLKLRFRHTEDIIRAVKESIFPKQAMLNFHPQRWNDAVLPWMKELVWQNAKNQIKRILVKRVNS